MSTTFLIADSFIIDSTFVHVGETKEVQEEEFWNILDSKIREVTEKAPEKYEQVRFNVKQHVLTNSKGITIRDMFFQIEKKK